MTNILPKGKFDFKNVARNLSSDAHKNAPLKEKKCEHFWINKKFVVKRNGNGDAEKTVCQKCAKCNEERTEHKTYNDTRIIYK